MSSGGKRKDEDVRASDDHDESETHAPPKKVAKPADEIEDIFICNLDKNRRVFVRNCNGRIWIAIRQFFVKDGISLSLEQWNDLRNHEEDIDKALSDLSEV
ncbi:Transcriptional coactivator p15 (PC4) [Arabidopsis thaliana x Arabidopsis arenosa]|nr:Transcriptional coactivator p15 (PC4) [Arabidopsis thaliana x Arabidopsis arenosa]